MLGAATSAHQIEGGTRNDWTAWEKGRYPDGQPHVLDGASAARAADSWNLWRADLAALQLLGANTYRLGIEWSRLEPAEGVWDEASAAHYREMLQSLVAAHIQPMVTLYHFTLPTWIADRGGWEWPGAPEAFAAFAARAGAAFGASVDLWCTINEPNVYVAKGYLAGQWPPGVKDPRRAGEVLRALMKAHALATAALRRTDVADADGDGRATRVGIAQNLRIFDAATANPIDGFVAGVAASFYNDAFLDSVAKGRIRISIPRAIDIDEAYPALAGTFDYLGVNYYTREFVIGHLLGPDHYVPTAPPELPAQRHGLGDLSRGSLSTAHALQELRLAAAGHRERHRRQRRHAPRRLHPRAHLRARPRARGGGRRHRLHLLVADGQLRVVARLSRALRVVLDRLRV